ncbi:hypothetical protein TTHERM_00460660 (macronuclear) [Tetrahymena thermophila SB210]|uniref:Uncharacterized protein n=1 Tax=Tetrahymena thermophila (strain SB210) TaxID=312017 RepID=Q23Q18_TETTS|nr:hypothetical protein TTHERM_00460660 [Tetrahymena thermophila SB210]EAR98517.2 hypothetical protein TTHERM_00460660 [Tetrahymena thermophila SB210]|eukprot:XP_001018762.2 hypothetical protein TTHERM_00460660 [Tetrahymena thermophila SB210]
MSQNGNNKQQQVREETPVIVAQKEIKEKWLSEISESIKDEERKFIFNLCFQIMRQRQNLEILQKNPSGDQRSQDLIKNNINEIQNVSLSKSLDDQQRSSYQIMKQIVNDYVVLEDEKYKIQKFRRNYLLRNAKQIGESIQIQPTTQGKAPQILQIHDYILWPQKNSIIQSEAVESAVLDKNIIEFNKTSILKWEEKTSKYRIVLIPQNLKKNFNQNGEFDQLTAKQNIELIYMIYFKSFYKLQKIMNYALITSRQDSIDQQTYVFNKCAKLFNRSLINAFLQKLNQYAEDLAIKKRNQQIDKFLDLPTVISQEDFSQTPLSKKKMESSLDQVVKGSQNELKEESPSKDKKSLELQQIPEEKESDQNFKSESQNQQMSRHLQSSSFSKKSSIILHKVENSDIDQRVQQDLESKQDNQGEIKRNQILSNKQRQQPQNSNESFQGDGSDKYQTLTFPNSPTIKIMTSNNENISSQKVLTDNQTQQTQAALATIQGMQREFEQSQKFNLDAPKQKLDDSGPITKQIFQQQKGYDEQQIANNLINQDSNSINQHSQKGIVAQTSSELKKSENSPKEKYLKVNDIINNKVQQDGLQENREQINQLMSQSQKFKVQQKLNLQDHKRSSQEKIGLKSRQGEYQSQQEFHSPIKQGNSSPNNFQYEMYFNKEFGQSGFLDYDSPLQNEESLYEKIINSKEKRTLANPNNQKGFDTPAKQINQQGQKKMIEMKSQVESYMQDPMVKQFIENENLQEHMKVSSEKLPVQLQQNSQNQEKQYCITKIMIYWYEEEAFDDFYNEVKDLVIGNNVVPLQELTYKFSNKKEINKSENVWQLDSRIQFSLDDIQAQAVPKKRMSGSGLGISQEIQNNQSFSTQKLFDASWKVAIRNERGIGIVNGELKIGETLLSCSEYGREQFLILKSPFASLSQSLFAILHLIIEVQATEKQKNPSQQQEQAFDKQENKPQQQELTQNKNSPNNLKNQQVYTTSFLKNSIQRIRNEENFMYYLITNKKVIIPKRCVWIKFINDPEINKIRQFYQLLQTDIEYKEVLKKCQKKLEDFNLRRIQKIIDWQGKMQAELLMLNVRKNIFDTLMLKSDKKAINSYIAQKGIPNEYRFCIYSSILDLHQQLVNTKQLLEELFKKPCTNVIQYLIYESKNYCNSLVVSASSFIYKKFPYEPVKSQAIFDLYQAYLMYSYITNDKPNQMLISPSINLLINIYENFFEEEQQTLAQNFQIQSQNPKLQQMKVSIPPNLSQNQQFRIACQQFQQQQFFVFASLMNLLKDVDFNFIFFSLMNRLSQSYANLNIDNQIPSLKDLIFQGCYSFFSNILVGELWNRIIDSVFIELIAIQKLEINFFLFCISKTIFSIYIDYHIEESIQLNQEFAIGECFDELIYDFYSVYLNTKRFFEVFCNTIKTDILIYQQITAQYSDYMTKIKLINSQSVYRQNYTYNNSNEFQIEENNLKEQFNLELVKLKDCEEYADKQISDQRQVDLFIYLNDIAPHILQNSVLIVTYEGIKQQKFIPYQSENGKKLKLSFKTKIPFLKTNSLYNEIEGREQIKFELIIQVSYQDIFFTGFIEWDPVNLFYNKTLVYLNQKNNMDIEKTLLLSIYLEPTQQQPNQPLIRNTVQNKYYDQNFIRNDVNTMGQCPIFMNEGVSLIMHKFDYRSLLITNISTTIDPLRFSVNNIIQKSQNISSKYPINSNLIKYSKEAINDWYAKISFLIANNSELSIDEKLQLLYLALKSAFGFEVSIKNVLLLFKEIARIQGFILSFESLIERISQIIGKRLKNSIVVSIQFIDENGNKQQFIANNQHQNYLLDTNVQILEKEYEEVISQTLDEGIHLVDIRTIISQVHQNLLLKNSITYLSPTNIIHNYHLQVMVDGCKNNYFIDSNGMIVITKSVQEQQILITKIPIFKNLSVSQSMFLGIMHQSPFMLSYFCKFPKLNYFTRQIPLALKFHFFDLKSQQLFSTEPIQKYTLVDSIGLIIEDLLSQDILPKHYSFATYSCLTADRQMLFLNDNLINQIDVQRIKELQDNNLLITLNVYIGQEPQYKLPYSEIEKCKILKNNYSRLDSVNINNSEDSYLQFQAAIFTKQGIDFQKIYKLPINDLYQFSDKKSRISEQNIYII